MTDRKLLQMALDALENAHANEPIWETPIKEAIEALRARLAQPEPWVKTYSGGKPNYTEPCERCGEVNPAEIHTCTPKQREWQKLTDDEIDDIWAEFNDGYSIIEETLWGYERAIEAKIREKNA